MWGECDAKRGSNEICSIMAKYLIAVDERKAVEKTETEEEKKPVHEIALYCDNCSGQQKNAAMFVTILEFLKTSVHVKKISLNFLMAGHTMMTADSVHATIERAVKHKTVHAPSEWLTIVANARHNPRPYNVIKLQYSDFEDWKDFTDVFNFKMSNDEKFKVSEVRIATFTKKDSKKGQFKVTLSARNVEDLITVRLVKKRNATILETPKQAYFGNQPISKEKYNDLSGLCAKGAIPAHLVKEFFDMPFLASVKDKLPQPDDEEASNSKPPSS